MDTKTLATILLVGHIIAVVVILMVLHRQMKIIRSRPDPELHAGRMVLLFLALGALIGNFVPITIDILVLVGEVQRNNPQPVGILYATSNVFTLVWEAIAILALYLVAEKLLSKKR